MNLRAPGRVVDNNASLWFLREGDLESRRALVIIPEEFIHVVQSTEDEGVVTIHSYHQLRMIENTVQSFDVDL